jgi:1-acyl-sn-glycerol-3-phosphate acyltransferase
MTAASSTSTDAPTRAPHPAAFRFRLARRLLRPLFRLLFRLLSRVRVVGLENIPRDGAYLIAINHVSIFEPPLVLAFWPTPPEAAGAVEIWERPGQNLLARLYGGIQVHRGEFDRQVVEKMLAVLKAGRPLLLAPEGGRTHTLGMRRALPGVAYLVDQTHAPVVPVGIVGSHDDFLRQALRLNRPAIEMRVGAPFTLPPIQGKGEARRLERQRNADEIMRHIAALLPKAYHGVYSDMEIDVR